MRWAIACAWLAGCAAGEWQHVIVRLDHTRPALIEGRVRTLSACKPRGRLDHALARAVIEFARTYLAFDNATILVEPRTEVGRLEISKPAGRWRTGTDYCIAVTTDEVTTTIVLREDRQWFR